MTATILRTACTTIVLASVVAGCGSDFDESDARRLVEWARVMRASVDVSALVYDGGKMGDAEDAAGAAEAIAAQAMEGVLAELGTCAAATRTGATVHYVFDTCANARTPSPSSGELTCTYEALGDAGGGFSWSTVAVHLQSAGAMTLGGASLEISGTARNATRRDYWSISGEDDNWRLSLELETNGTTPAGMDITTRPDATGVQADYDGACAELFGGTEAEVDGRVMDPDGSYRTCGGGCPEAGGYLQLYTQEDGYVVSVDLDGSATASARVDGEDLSLQLDCAR